MLGHRWLRHWATVGSHWWANVILASGPTLAQQWHATVGPPVDQRWATGGSTVGPPLAATGGPTSLWPVGQRWPNSGMPLLGHRWANVNGTVGM